MHQGNQIGFDAQLGYPDDLQQQATGSQPTETDLQQLQQQQQEQQQQQWPQALLPRPQQQQQPQQPQSMHHGGSFKTYFAHKNLKLQEQFEAQALGQLPRSQLFKGVSIHVNGLTVPTHAELKQLMALHGGNFETYYHRSRVTHIVCSNLPDTKLKQLQHARDPVPIVKPEWIVASLRAGQLLPVKDFLLKPMRDLPGQRTLFDHQAHAAAPVAATELYPALAQQQAQQAQPAQQAGHRQQLQQQVLEQLPQQPQQPVQHRHQYQHQGPHQQQQQPSEAQEADTMHPAAAAAVAPAAAGADSPGPAVPAAAAATAAAAAAAAGGDGSDGGISANDQRAQALAASLRASCDLLKGPPRSTADDPQGFVGSFFKSSRLHFIGSWKARVEALMADHYQQQQQQQQLQAGPAAAAAAGSVLQPLLLGVSSGGNKRVKPAGAAAQQQQRVIVHLDMDCFFAAIAVVGRPEFAGKPLAVCHSASAQGSGEVSSANYEARAFGISAGMMIADAKARCPALLVVPYEFDKYEEASLQVYRILLRHSPIVQPLSVDEAFMDLTPLGFAGGSTEVQQLVAKIRQEIAATTGCTASAGIGPNMLLARLATKRAKPNGQAVINPEDARVVLGDLEVDALPGVGWSLRGKLADMGITRVRQVWSSSKEVLMRRLGAQTGASLWQHAHGIDDRPVAPPKARRSVGAEVNWGVRFSNAQEAETFLKELCNEVASRLAAASARAKTVTLKLKRRQQGAPEPAKFLGHGACDNLSRSVTVGRYIASSNELYQQASTLLSGLKVPVEEIRGLGITASKLDSDVGSRDARPSAPHPAKLPPAKHGVFDSSRYPWAAWVMPKKTLQQHQHELQQQQEQQQQEQQGQEQQLQCRPPSSPQGGVDIRAALAFMQPAATAPSLGAASLGRKRPHKEVIGSPAQVPGAAALLAAADDGPTEQEEAGLGAGPPYAKRYKALSNNNEHELQHEAHNAWENDSDDAGGYMGGVVCSLPDASQPDEAAAILAAAAAAAGEEEEDRMDHALAAAAAADGDDEACMWDSGGSPAAKRRLFGRAGAATAAAAGAAAAAAAAVSTGEQGTGVQVEPSRANARVIGFRHEQQQQQQQPQELDSMQPQGLIAALPPPEHLDPEVLAALPADVRMELEAAYASRQQQQQHHQQSRGAGHQSKPSSRRPKLHHQQQQMLRRSSSPAGHGHAAAGAAAAAAASVQSSHVGAAVAAVAGDGVDIRHGNWLTRVSEAAAAAKRQKQKQQLQWGVVNAGRRGQIGSSNHDHHQHLYSSRHQQQHQQQHPHPSELLISMDQVDPQVLAELPPELQQELRAALPGRPRGAKAQQTGRLGAGPGTAPGSFAGACSLDPDPALMLHHVAPMGTGAVQGLARADQAGADAASGGAGQLQRRQEVGLGRMWSVHGQHRTMPFADEPAVAVLAALNAALDALAPVAACASNTDAYAVVDAPGSGPDEAEVAGPNQERVEKLLVLGEYLAQWLVAHDHDLEGVKKVVQGTVKAGRIHAEFKDVAHRLVHAVRQHVQTRYGLVLALKDA